MKTIEENRREVVEVFDALVEKLGYDYVYPYRGGACFYVERVRDDAHPEEVIAHYLTDQGHESRIAPVSELKPSCIIGQLLAGLGVNLQLLAVWNSEGWAQTRHNLTPDDWPDDLILQYSLIRAQNRSDVGMPWGEVVEHFKRDLQSPERVTALDLT